MSAEAFISRRWDAAREMPRSVRRMRAIAQAGIAVAVTALVLALAIGRGFEKAYSRALLDFNAHVIVMGPGEFVPTPEIREAIEGLRFDSDAEAAFARRYGFLLPWLQRLQEHSLLPGAVHVPVERLRAAMQRGVIATTPFLYREALAVGGGAIRGVVVKGVDPATLHQVSGVRIEPFDAGQTLAAALEPAGKGPPRALLGRALAATLGITGSPASIRLLIPREGGRAKGEQAFDEIRVTGTFASGMHDYDAEFLLMELGEARRLFGAGAAAVTGLEVKLDDPQRAPFVAPAIEGRLGPQFRAIRWDELNADLLAAVRLEKLVSAVIMGIMFVVAALNIVSALVLNAIRRMSEISLLKALGLPNPRIERILVRSGMSIGLRGVIIGMAAGIAIALAVERLGFIRLDEEIYMIGSLPIDISGPICGIMLLFCAGILFVTSKGSARTLASVPPSEGLARAR